MKKFITAFLAAAMLTAVPAYAATLDTTSISVIGSSASEFIGTISVSGEGRVSVMPDMAVLNIGTTITGETTAIQQESAETMEKVIAAIKASGVAEADIKTSSYNLNPNYDYQNINKDGTHDIIGYTMSHMVEVIVRDIDTAGAVLSNAVEAGANENWGINFSLSNPEEYYGEALALAIADAENRAQIIADTIGVTIDKPIDVRESGGYYVPRPIRGGYGAMTTYDMAVAESAMAAPVSAGELEISASVSLMYRY